MNINRINPGQRMFQRAPMEGRVYIHDEDKLFIAPLCDISAGGIFIGDMIQIQKGKRVKIVIKAPCLEEAIQAEGDVVRIQEENNHKGRGSAVQFSHIDQNAQLLIQHYVYQQNLQSEKLRTYGR